MTRDPGRARRTVVDELGSWDAVETAERIRSREVSAKEVVEAAIVRAEASAHLGAVVSTTCCVVADAGVE